MARKPEKKTQVIRQLIDEYGDLTWAGDPSAKDLLAEMGYSENAKDEEFLITEGDFNVKKHLYRRQQGLTKVNERPKGRKPKPVYDEKRLKEIVAIVNKAGGLDASKEKVAKLRASRDKLRERLKEAEKKLDSFSEVVRSFESVQEVVRAAS